MTVEIINIIIYYIVMTGDIIDTYIFSKSSWQVTSIFIITSQMASEYVSHHQARWHCQYWLLFINVYHFVLIGYIITACFYVIITSEIIKMSRRFLYRAVSFWAPEHVYKGTGQQIHFVMMTNFFKERKTFFKLII